MQDDQAVPGARAGDDVHPTGSTAGQPTSDSAASEWGTRRRAAEPGLTNPFATGSAQADTVHLVHRLADFTRGRDSIRQLPAFAAQLLRTSSAHVAFLSDSQEVQAGVGLGAAAVGLSTPTEESVCSVTVRSRAVTAIADAPSDPRVASMPPVLAGQVRSYLGVPLEVRGLVVGALCVFDAQPRDWTTADADLLRGLAAPLLAELELAALGMEYEDERLLWRLAVDAAEVGAFDWYLAEDELRWDERLLDIFGLDANTFGGTIGAFNDAVHPDDRARVSEALRTAIDTCGTYAAEYRIVRPDGQVRWISARGRALAGSDGVASRVVGAASDTTAAVEGEASTRRVLEAMPSAFFHLDREWRFAYLNSEASRLLGDIGSEIRGAVIWELFPASVGSDFERHYRGAVESGVPVEFEAYYPPPLDTWYDVRAWPTPDGLSVYFADATDRRRGHELLEVSRDRAQLLTQASDALTGTLHPQAAAEELAHLVVGTFAEWSIVSVADHPTDATDLGDTWRRSLRDLAGWHRDAGPRDTLRSLLAERIPALLDESAVATAVREGRAVVLRTHLGELDDHASESVAGLARALGTGAVAVLPLQARGRIVGLLTLGRNATDGPFASSDLEVLSEIAARAGLALDNSRLYAEQRDLAEQLQRSLLTEPPELDGLQIAARYIPATQTAQVGGDWYDAFDCGDGSTIVVIGDVMGHDTAAAAEMGQLRALVRGIAVTAGGGPSVVLERVDAAMDTLKIETTASTIVARLGAATAAGVELTWANAGHPPLAVVLPASDRGCEQLHGGEILLGIEPETRRTNSVRHLPPGSVLLLYTDGLVERRGTSIDDGMDRVASLLAELVAGGGDLEDICDQMLSLLPPDHEDDVALIAVRVRDQDSRHGLAR